MEKERAAQQPRLETLLIKIASSTHARDQQPPGSHRLNKVPVHTPPCPRGAHPLGKAVHSTSTAVPGGGKARLPCALEGRAESYARRGAPCAHPFWALTLPVAKGVGSLRTSGTESDTVAFLRMSGRAGLEKGDWAPETTEEAAIGERPTLGQTQREWRGRNRCAGCAGVNRTRMRGKRGKSPTGIQGF